MEMLEKDRYIRIMKRGANWSRCVDDVLVIMPKNINVENKLRMLNAVNEYIFLERETKNKLPFLDTVVHRVENIAKFFVYRKLIDKDNFIHYLSVHSDRTKSGAVIGFHLRALRECDKEFLNHELTYVTQAFKKLSYPL